MQHRIYITTTAERIEPINARLLAAQVEIGGCIVYVGDLALSWEPEGTNTLEDAAQVLDTMIALGVFDPTLDMFSISADYSGNRGDTWTAGFRAGMANGLAFRNTSVDALQRALMEAELALKDEKARADILSDENHLLKHKVVAWEQAWAHYDKTADRYAGDVSLIEQITLTEKPFPCPGPGCPDAWEGSDSNAKGERQ